MFRAEKGAVKEMQPPELLPEYTYVKVIAGWPIAAFAGICTCTDVPEHTGAVTNFLFDWFGDRSSTVTVL